MQIFNWKRFYQQLFLILNIFSPVDRFILFPKTNGMNLKSPISFFLLSLCIVCHSYSQDKDLHIVATAGDVYQVSGMQLDWTLGETVIHTLENSSVMITQGFHQPYYTLVSVNPVPDKTDELLVWPNPFDDEFEISLSLETPQGGMIGLFDMTGKQIWNSAFEGKVWHQKFAATSLSSGQYLLTVTPAEGANIYSYQLIKTQ